MTEITFKVLEDETHYSCGCVTKVVGANFFVTPCGPNCEVFEVILKESMKKGNIISVTKEERPQ